MVIINCLNGSKWNVRYTKSYIIMLDTLVNHHLSELASTGREDSKILAL